MIHLTRNLRHCIVNPSIAHKRSVVHTDRKHSFYPVVGLIETKLGAMYLNKPDNNNNITEECCDQLFRFINSYHHDHTVENVFLQNKGKTFSGGADYEELLCNQLYLDKLFRMAIMLANFNKPIFAKVNGSVRGIGAYLINMMSTPLGTQSSSLRLDQTARGFIPIIGGSNQLSNLPCNLGVYLALTGQKLNKDEMNRINFLRGTIRDQYTSSQVRNKLSNANLFWQNPYPAQERHLSEFRKDSFVRTKINEYKNMIADSQKQLFNSKRNFYTKFALNQYRIAKTDYENIMNPFTSFSDRYYRSINNYYEMREERPFNFLKKFAMVEEGKSEINLLSGVPLEKIISIFGQKTVHEMLQSLTNEGSQWAKQTEKQLRKKDPLALYLTFHLIKKAETLSWTETLELQYAVARRLLDISQVTLQTNQYASRKIFVNPYSSKTLEEIDESEILTKFFNSKKSESEILQHDVVNHALLPASKYYKNFPDSVRNYLNDTFFEDVHNKNNDKEVRRFLQINKVDYRDHSYDKSILRQHIYKDVKYLEYSNMEKMRLKSILQRNSSGFDKFKQQKYKLIQNKLRSNRAEAITMISNKIKKEFNKYFDNRFEQFQSKTAKIAGKQSKMNIFKNYQKTLMDNIVMNGYKYEQNNNNVQHQGIVRFDGEAKEGGTIFTARETQMEANNEFIKDIKKNYKANNCQMIDEEIIEKYRHSEKESNMLFDYGKTPEELEEIKKQQRVMKNYGKQLMSRNHIAKYQYLIDRASNTSDEVASLLGWEDEDIKSVLMNAPKTPESYIDFAKKLRDNSKKAESSLDQKNEFYNILMTTKQEAMKHLSKGKISSPFKQGNNKFYLFDLQRIPVPFRKTFVVLLEQVITTLSEKYKEQGPILSQLGNQSKQWRNIMDLWVENSVKRDVTEFLKNDVEYIFSYLSILYIRDILESSRDLTTKGKNVVETFLNVTGFDFQRDISVEKAIKQCNEFLYKLLDMHADAKSRILFPQSKVLDFINRQKIKAELSTLQFSFESLMVLVAKDRKRIRDIRDGKKPLLGYQPEYTLSIMKHETEKYLNHKRLDLTENKYRPEANPWKQQFESEEQLRERMRYVEQEEQDKKKMENWEDDELPIQMYKRKIYKQQADYELVLDTEAMKKNDGRHQMFMYTPKQEQTSTFVIPEPLQNRRENQLVRMTLNPQNKIQDHLRMLYIHSQGDPARQKRLIVGFQSYLMKLQTMMHKIAGKDMFLPDQSRNQDNKQIYESMKKLLRTDLSDDEWFELEMEKCVGNLLAFRYQRQKYYSKSELQSFDEFFFQMFTPESIETLLKHQLNGQQQFCRTMVKQPRNSFQKQTTREQDIENMYLQIKNQVKNPKALQMLNNLKMADNVMRDREIQIQQMNDDQNDSDKTDQQMREFREQIDVVVPETTYRRLANEMFRYQDDELDPKEVRADMKKALKQKQKKSTRFLDEIKMIKDQISNQQLKEEMNLRIERLQMIQ